MTKCEKPSKLHGSLKHHHLAVGSSQLIGARGCFEIALSSLIIVSGILKG